MTKPPYEHEKGEDGQYVDLAAENAKALAIELSPDLNSIVPYLYNLLTGEQRQAYWFGKNWVQSACKWEPLLSETIDRVIKIKKPNISLLLGILNGIFNCDSAQWEIIVKRLSETGELIPHYASIINSGKVTPDQLSLLVEFIAQNKITPLSANTLTYGRPIEHLSVDIVCKFTLDLATVSDNAAWVALDILSMYCHSNRERWEQCRAVLADIVIKLPLDKNSGQNQLEIHLWHDVAEKLLISEGAEFAKVISKNIIVSCSDKLDYGDLWHYVRPLIRKIFQQYGRVVWPLFAEAIKNADSIKEHRLTQLLNPGDLFDKREPSVLAELPDDILREWCIQEPDVAPEFVARTTDVLLDTADGFLISPRARFLLDNFGDDKDVLSVLSANIGSFGWTGSLVPYYQREKTALEILKSHQKANVREWVNKRIDYLAKMIEKEKRRDEERDWGIY